MLKKWFILLFVIAMVYPYTFVSANENIALKPEFTVIKKYVSPIKIASIRFNGQYDESFEVYEKLNDQVSQYANGNVMSLYHQQNDTGADIEVCIPVSESVEGAFIEHKGKQIPINTKILEGGHFLSVIHQGPPETLRDAWESMDNYIEHEGLEIVFPTREIYLYADPTDPLKKMTELQLQLRD